MPISRTWLLASTTLAIFTAAAAAWLGYRWHKNRSTPPDKPVVWVNQWHHPVPQIEHFALDSKAMGHPVGVSVHVPSHDQPAPVIYFLHGRGGNEITDVAPFMKLLNAVLARYALPEPLVVFPNGGVSGYGGTVERMIVDELVPYIDEHYATLPGIEFRLLAGYSMGGVGAVRLAIHHPQIFGGAASWGGGVFPKDLEAAAGYTGLYRELGTRFLLVNGTRDRPKAFAPLADLLQQNAVLCEQVTLPGVNHHIGLYFDYSVPIYAEHLLALWRNPS
jgi:enterochelin esterase-like enzyme